MAGQSLRLPQMGTRGGGEEKLGKIPLIVSGRAVPFIFGFRQALARNFVDTVCAGVLYTPPFLFRVGGRLVTRCIMHKARGLKC